MWRRARVAEHALDQSSLMSASLTTGRHQPEVTTSETGGGVVLYKALRTALKTRLRKRFARSGSAQAAIGSYLAYPLGYKGCVCGSFNFPAM